eukprot:CAMPEP_0196141084 /NCGR_PEP_ID=MMETSP0910-20130528/8762_1 /TAXON_ID=49265 /ORGANISM="Thalassiosira rotula, Strain GSO102" /LENGTH=205 /DNA_ID=CAMNT_0041402121 /DNA_START=26 /DNA_END=643 /DNA_ORIENTATION=+
MIPTSIECPQNMRVSIISSIGASSSNIKYDVDDDDSAMPIPPSLTKCRNTNSPTASSTSASSLSDQTIDNSQDGGDTPPSPTNNYFPRRNRSDNLILWSERETKMFYLRIAGELYDESAASYREPAQLPGCFTEEERRKIVQSVTTTSFHCKNGNEPIRSRNVPKLSMKDVETAPYNKIQKCSRSSKKRNFNWLLDRMSSTRHAV